MRRKDEIMAVKSPTVFIDERKIISVLQSTPLIDRAQVKDILAKSLSIETLTPDETAVLLNVEDRDILEEMKKTALKVKEKVYDNRIVTFAPLYLSNFCVNDCLYCGFRKDNTAIKRKILSLDEVREETAVLAGEIGHKRLIVVYGDYPSTDIDYIVSTIREIYKVHIKTKTGVGSIRRVNVNAMSMSIDDLKKLREAGIGTYQVFQETYHRPTYMRVHPHRTPKSDYEWRLYTMHRAFKAGIDDVGIGALFGLYDWRFEVMGLLYHARELETEFSIGPHTISFPRLEPAENTPFTGHSRYQVSNDDFIKLLMVLRLAVPYTGMIITARERAAIRRESVLCGITQTDASTKIGIGTYGSASQTQEGDRQQFMLGDTRSLDEVVCELAAMGHITSFCTAGYRCGRTGKKIMRLLRSGQEGKFCKLNAVLTFKEWLNDFAGDATKETARKVLVSEINEIKEEMPDIFPTFMEFYKKIESGERDLYF